MPWRVAAMLRVRKPRSRQLSNYNVQPRVGADVGHNPQNVGYI